MNSSRHSFIALALCATLALTACSSTPKTMEQKAQVADYPSANDPIESVNRVIFDVNDFLDRLLIKPLAGLYRAMVPPPVRDRIAGIVKNMDEPVILANNLLQGEFTSGATTTGRFLSNTILGGGGMFEVANDFGLPRQKGDFGQTLHVWGLGEGPYLVLPLFGPSNLRDAVGLGVDTFISPWQYLADLGGRGVSNRFMYADISASALVRREENIEALDALREGSIDFYAQMRSVYRQYRAKHLGVTAQDTPVFEDDEKVAPPPKKKR